MAAGRDRDAGLSRNRSIANARAVSLAVPNRENRVPLISSSAAWFTPTDVKEACVKHAFHCLAFCVWKTSFPLAEPRDADMRLETYLAFRSQGRWTLAYVLVLIAAAYVALGYPSLGEWRTAVMMLPLIPAFGILKSTISQIQRSDEMMRRNQLVAVAWAFGITQFLMITWCLLEVVGWSRLPMWITFIVMQGVWITCIWTQVLRYR